MPDKPFNMDDMRKIDALTEKAGFADSARIRFSPDLNAKLAESERDSDFEGMPEYVLRDRPFKKEPASFAPWAKTAMIFLGSFRELPPAPGGENLKRVDIASPFAGLVAGYMLRLDYHRFAKTALEKVAAELETLAGRKIKTQALCDANPLPERSLALLSGLGTPGPHRCLLASSTRDGVFIATLLTDLELPELIHEKDAASLCNRCGACVAECPSGALDPESGRFDCSRCLANILETRGELAPESFEKAGAWIAGCGECVRACQRSKTPPPVALDLEWLLSCKNAELERALAMTPLAHYGVALLRRNALAALSKRELPETRALIERTARESGSEKLRAFAKRLLEGRAS